MFEQSIAKLDECRRKLEQFRLGAWIRSERAMLPAWKSRPRSFKTLPDGQVIVQGEPHTVRTQYLRRNWNENDVALLQRIIQAQPQTFTFEQAMAGRKFKTTAARVDRVRNGKF